MDIDKLKKEEMELVRRCFIFNRVGADEVLEILKDESCKLHDLGKGDTFFDIYDYRSNLCLVLSGKLKVKNPSNRRYVMNRLSRGSVFGAANLFDREEKPVSVVTADKASRILTLPIFLIERVMKSNFLIAENYIVFLSGRIKFLNEKISELTSVSANAALARHLMNNYNEEDGKKAVKLDNVTKLTQEINVGRTSMYRALDTLECANCIKREGKTVEITDIKELKKFMEV
jgi:CRP-like cAMP-binding protein